MVECRYYGACRYASGNCSNGGDDAPDCEDFVQMPDVDALLALADDMENCGDSTDRSLRKAGILRDSWAECASRIRKAVGA